MTRATLLIVMLAACGGGAQSAASSGSASSGSASTASEAAAPSEAGARAAKAELAAASLTSAPARVVARARLNASIEEVWDYVSNHDNLVEYTNGILQSADIDRSGAGGSDGVGVRRECAAGQDRFVEEIVYFRAPYAFAYSAVENTWGLTNHLATVVLTPDGDGTILEWSQHFDHMQPEALPMMTENLTGMMNGPILGFFTQRFGGEVLAS
ncbi:MAG: SRPBCC family protein [Myxococcota bacterium]